MSDAREQILASLRSGTAATPPPLPDVLTSARAQTTPSNERAAAFTDMLGKLGAPVESVKDLDAATTRVAAILSEHNITSLATSDASDVLTIAGSLPDNIEHVPHDASHEQQLAAKAGLSTAQWGIAETGTLVLVSAEEQHRRNTLLPDLHIALLPTSRLLDSLGDAFSRLHDGTQPAARTITFITGPSRTADIELELVVGVHGPKHLHVLLTQDS